MSAKAIHEAAGKALLAKHLPKGSPGAATIDCATVVPDTNWDKLLAENPALFSQV